MKLLLIIFILFTSSCSQIDLNIFIKQDKFDELARENLFDSDLALRKIKNDSNDVKIIKVQKIEDIVSTIVKLSTELKDETIVHFIEFSTDEQFKVNKEIIKNIAQEKNCNLVVYVEANEISKYILSSDRKTIKIKEKKGYHFFNAFFYSKVKLNSSYEIKNN
jgi:hypothetical protein